MTKPSILIFGHGYATQFIDISNQYTQLYDLNKYDVTVAYLVGAPNEQVRKQHLAHNVFFIDSPKKSTRNLKSFAIQKMLQLHKQKNFKVVICHRYKPTYIMLGVNLFKKIPLLFSVMHELGTFKSFSRKLLMSFFARKNVIFAGVSNAVRDDLRLSIWGIPKDRIITLYNMIDVAMTEKNSLSMKQSLDQLKLSDNLFIFGTMGRLAINKDHKTLIYAFAKIHYQCPNAKLVIVGDGQLDTELKSLVNQLNLTDNVVFTGFIPKSFRLLKAFNVYISSSIQEAFGRVLLEAMIAKVPIIATAVNGVPEVIGHAGILIEAGNVSQLAKEMLALYQASEQERMVLGEKGYQRATHDFSLEKFNEIYWNLNSVKALEMESA